MIRIAILVSGNGSNLQALVDACASGRIQGSIVGVISNRADAFALERAKKAGVRQLVIPHEQYATRAQFEQALIDALQAWQVDLIVLAGFMRVLTAAFVTRFSGQIINIHPSLLPAYKGLRTYERVLATGDKLHGCSVHFVTPELDSGAVIAQSLLNVHRQDNVNSLTERVHQLEHVLYPRIVGWIAAGRVVFLGNRVYLDGQALTQPIQFYNPN